MSIDLVNPPPGYEVIDYLGGGAMGDVYLARQVSLGRKVALKVSKRHIDRELHTTLERMLDEALTIARLDHPNIVPVYDCISHDSRVFIVMKYVEGYTLADFLKGYREEFSKAPYAHFFKEGKLRREAVIEIALRVAEALAYAHERGIYHRDIKPSNIFIDHKGRIILIDFGIARDTSRQGMTATGVVLGTPHYMSPEQIRGMALDGRSDLYALGCILFHCLAGRVPFNDTNEVMVCIKHLNDPLPSLDTYAPDLDPDLNAIVVSLLEKDREERLSSAEELVAHMSRIHPGSSDAMHAAAILHKLGDQARGSSSLSQAIKKPATAEMARVPATRRKSRAVRYAAVGTLLVVLVMAILVELAERPGLNLPVNLSALKRENWLMPLMGTNSASDRPAVEPHRIAEPEPVQIEEAEEHETAIEIAAVPIDPRTREQAVPESPTPTPRPTPHPTPVPTPTPEPAPLPLWMAVPPPDGLLVNQESWQPFVDWLAPRGQRFDLVRPAVSREMELIGDFLYMNVENPLEEDLEIAFIAKLQIAETTVARTPFGLVREQPRTLTVHRGIPFRDHEDESTVRDGKRIILAAGERQSVPLCRVVPVDGAVLGVDVVVVSLVVAGRGARLELDLSGEFANPATAPGLREATSNFLGDAPLTAQLDMRSFKAPVTLRQTVEAQTRLVMPPAPQNPARAEVLSDEEVTGNIIAFLLDVDSHAREGRQLLPSLITNQRLEATINGGAELVLTLESEPGDLLISAVILNGLQEVSLSHVDGMTRQSVRPLAGMAVSDHPVRLAIRGGMVRVPLVRWTMQPGQEAVVASRLDVKTLAVHLHTAHPAGERDQPPRFRRITNLEASR